MRRPSFLALLFIVFAVAGSATPRPSGVHSTINFPSAVSDADRAFMSEAATGGMAEVEMGRPAASKGRSPAVKQFGRRMVRDHSKANTELKQLARRKAVTLPTALTEQQKQDKAKLSRLSGAEFDRKNMSMMVEDHDKDVKAFEDKAGNADDADLKRFVTKTLPTLKISS